MEPLTYRCTTGVRIPGGEVRGRCLLQAVLDSGSSISIIGEAGLRRLHRRFPEVPAMHPYDRRPSVTVADGRGQIISQKTGVLAAHIITPWLPVVIDQSVAVWLGGDDGLRAKALGHGELSESEDSQVAVPGADSTTAVDLRIVTVLLGAMQSVADAEEGANISQNSQLQGAAVGAGTSDGDGEREPVGAGGAGAGARAREGGAGRYAAGEMTGALGQSVGRAGGCVPPGSDRGRAGAGRADEVQVEAAHAGPQGETVPEPAGEAPVAVATDGKVETDGAGFQQSAGCICERRHGHAES